MTELDARRAAHAVARWFLTAMAILVLAVCFLSAIDRSITARAADLHSVASGYSGLHERKNNKALRRLLGVNPARTPWCGAFAAVVARKAGKKPPRGYMRARAWLAYGKPVRLSAARRGDIIVLRRHVGILQTKKGGKVCLIGGNQSNRVKVSCYHARQVIGVRR